MSFPGLSPTLAAAAEARRAAHEQEAEAVRRRVRASMPPVPELRFEIAYLRSILPGLTPRSAPITKDADGGIHFDKPGPQATAVALYEGEPMGVDWGRVVGVTIKDQVGSERSERSERSEESLRSRGQRAEYGRWGQARGARTQPGPASRDPRPR